MKEWAFSICLAIIVGCIVKIISPNGGIGKIINFSMSVFLISCIFSGVIIDKGNIELGVDIFDDVIDINEKLKFLEETQTLGDIEEKLKILVNQDLLLKGISNAKILININTNDKSNILINKMEIFIDKGERKNEQDIKNYLQEKYKVIPNIVYN